MRIKKIKLENIRSFEELELEFPKGSTLLAGDIGSGKSSVLFALEFALFGLQPGQKGASLLRNNASKGGVVLEIEVEDKQITIERRLKREKTVSQETATISVNGQSRELSLTELKNEVLRLLNYPLEFSKKTNLLYRFTVYTPQEEMKEIITEKPDVRLDTLRHVFGIDRYKKIQENVEIVARKLREEIRNREGYTEDIDARKASLEEKDSVLRGLKIERFGVEEELKGIVEERKKIEKDIGEIEKKQEEKKNFEKEFEKTEMMLESKKRDLTSLKKQLGELEKQLIEKIEFNEAYLSELKVKKQDSHSKIDLLEDEKIKLRSQEASLKDKKNESMDLRQRVTELDRCPTCLQEVNPGYKINLSNKLNREVIEVDKRLKELGERLAILDNEILMKKKERLEFENQISEMEILRVRIQAINEKKAMKERLKKDEEQKNKDIDMLTRLLAGLREQLRGFVKFEIFYIEKKRAMENIFKSEREKEIRKAELGKEIELLTMQIKELSEEIELKIKEKEKIAGMREIEDWFSGKFSSLVGFVEKNVMLTLREEFSKLFNEWFTILVSDNISVRLDEEFTPIIEQQGFEIDYSFLSGGERTAIALAYRLALNQTINSLLSRINTKDLVILDEPTDGFSEQQLDKMRDVLSQLNAQQLIIVSHENKIEGFVDNIIKMKKENHISSIESMNLTKAS
ncbi:hypothetical protein COV15_02320 [Candidatus Woesearchaeota archaeon CG10_big_fil_rev_8_21_14_0_10_34_12]|nr:MAG: hypothetical protein COV15_02320 [Candidatus Woesearchaeota archaeon CG10_big_fil_rev_8_21_14_0_10_34_12]